MRRPRLLFYAVDGLGLGHVTRMLALARAVRRLSPDAEILFLTASEAAHIIYSEGFAALKLPSRAAASAGRLRGSSWLRLAQTIVWNAVAAFDPHALVVDTFAAGTLHELLPILRWPLRKIFVFRAQRAERAADPFLQSTLRLYDLILVPHEPGSETIPLPEGVAARWTGPMLLRDADELLPRAQARAALGLPPHEAIGLITLGGGGEPETARARERLRAALVAARNEMLWVEAQGPLARRSTQDASDPASANGQAHWRVLRDVHPLMIYLHAFDCAVASAGYNTTHELQAAGVPAILWPFARDLDDQEQRARRLEQAGRALCVGTGTDEDGAGEDGAGNEGQRRVAELAAALERLAQPAERERLRAAICAPPDTWRNGAASGAEAVLELLQ